MKTNYAKIGEEMRNLISDLIMDCNEENIGYDDWYLSVDQSDGHQTRNIQNILFRLEYSHDNHEEIDDLERKVRELIFENNEEIEKLSKGK